MNLYTTLKTHIQTALQILQKNGQLPAEISFENVSLDLPKDPTHGDFATNAALVLAKPAKLNPRAIGDALAAELQSLDIIQSVTVAGPGFVNITLTPAAWLVELQALNGNPSGHLAVNTGQGRKILVEFVSINPTGPIHVGHGRNAVLGDVLCRLLSRTGYNVHREYLINDAGNQIRALVFSVLARYRELFGEDLNLPENGYVGEYIIPIAQKLKDQDDDKWLSENDEDAIYTALRGFCVDACMENTKTDLEQLDVHFDTFHSEYAMHQAGDPLADAVKILREKGDVFEGALPPPKGVAPEDYEAVDLTLFNAEKYGLQQNKPIYNRRGQATYFGQDIAYHAEKLTRNGGQEQLVTVVAQEQRGNFEPLCALMEALTGRKNTVHPLYYALVKAMRHGQPVKLSKRAGNIIALSDVIDEVGADAYRFHMLTRKAETELTFDLGLAVENSMENPVFYVQYAHARCCSIFRQYEQLQKDNTETSSSTKELDISALDTPDIRYICQIVAQYPHMLAQASMVFEPHRIAFYTQELAAVFHSWYGKGKFLEISNLPATHARLEVVRAVQQVLADALATMGVSAPESM